MKKFLLSTVGLLASLWTAQAQYFTPGNLAVVRIGGNSGGTTQNPQTTGPGSQVWIDQYTTNGTLVNSFQVPASGGNALIMSGEPYEGDLSLTADGKLLVLAGYNATAPYTSELIDSTDTAVPRVVGTLDVYGNFAVPITNTSVYNTYTCMGAASDGSNFWMAGNGPSSVQVSGIVYVGTATMGTTVQLTTNLFSGGCHNVQIYNGMLFGIGYSSNTSLPSIDQGGGYLLTNSAGNLPQTGAAFSNYFAETSAGDPQDLAISPDGTVAYIADYSEGLIKYTNGPSGWVSNYTIVLSNTAPYQALSGSKYAISVTADWSGLSAFTNAILYATTDESYTNRLVRLIDTGTAVGANGTIMNLASNFLQSGSGGHTNCFRGVRFVPYAEYAYISVQPASFTGNPGMTATFSATVLGSPTPTCQWYSNSVGNPAFVAIPGATATNFSLANINTSESGSEFYLVVSNIYEVSTSAVVTLTIQNPAIVTEPMGETNFPGTGPVTLCVTADGTGTLTYQWLSNSVDISGATSSCYTVPSSAVSNSALYSVIVSNSSGSVTSSVTAVAYSPYLLYDTLDYPNGNLFTAPGTPWSEISGTSAIPCTNGRVQINESNGAASTAIGHDLFTLPQSDGVYLWASFTINLSTLPSSPAGVYFGSFADSNFDFFGKLYVLTSNNPAYTPDIPSVAYPGTYRIGVANYTGPNAVVELDMAPGIDYDVVVYYSVGGFAQVSVNPSPEEYSQSFYPSGPNTLTSGYASDTYTYTEEDMSSWELHEPYNVGVLELSDLQVSYDWSGAGSGFAAVTAAYMTNPAVIGLQPAPLTNYLGNPGMLEVAASGIDLTYQWFQNGVALNDTTNFAGSQSNALVFSYLAGADSGSYTCVVSNEAGAVTSSVAVVDVVTTPTAPMFTLQPVSTTNSLGGTAVFTAMAVGTGPITYEWYQDGVDTGVSGSTLILAGLTTNMSGDVYDVIASSTAGSTTSSNAILTVNGPIVTNIAFLRSLQVTSAAPTITVPASNSVQIYQVTGTVISATNEESSSYVEYYIQDKTGGIEFFVDHSDPNFQPAFGDVISASGVVNAYSDALEFEGTYQDAAEPYYIVTNASGPVVATPPTPTLIPFGFPQANPGLSSLVYEGSLCTITNVYFTTYTTNTTSPATFLNEQDLELTNNSGQILYLYTGESDGPDIIGAPVPRFAYSITGPFDQYETTEYQIVVAGLSNIVTAPPQPITNLTASLSGTNITLTWPIVPAAYTYNVLATTNLTQPFTPLATGLWFGTSNGTYTVAVPTNAAAMFFQIGSPTNF